MAIMINRNDLSARETGIDIGTETTWAGGLQDLLARIVLQHGMYKVACETQRR